VQVHSSRSSQPITPLIIACLLATWVVWGSTYLAIKFALVSLPPFLQMGSRFIVAGAVLFLFLIWRRAALPTLVQWRNALVIGTLMLGGGMGGTAFAEQSVASGLIVAVIAIQPVVQALLGWFWGTRLNRLEWLGVGVGTLGVWLLVQGQGFASSPTGLAVILSAVFFWGLGSVLSQKVFPLAPGAMGYASEMILGGMVLMLMAWAYGEKISFPLATSSVVAWFYLVVFGSLIAFNAYMILLSKASPGLATSYSFVNPVIALGLGVTIGNEVVSSWEWGSVGLVLVGVVIIVVANLKKNK
jgi:drug/metabolite transporter (DMT)-like permease